MPLFKKNAVPILELSHDFARSATIDVDGIITVADLLQNSVPSLTTPGAGFLAKGALRSGHVQTMFAAVRQIKLKPVFTPARTQLLRLYDGGIVSLDISKMGPPDDASSILINVHGLGGHSTVDYVQQPLVPFLALGWRCICVTMRGCGGLPLTSPELHNGSSYEDIGAVLAWTFSKWPKAKIHLMGTSLGGVIIGNLVGIMGDDCPAVSATLISPIFDFKKSAETMRTGLPDLCYDPILGMEHMKMVRNNKLAFDLDHYNATKRSMGRLIPSRNTSPIASPFLSLDSLAITIPISELSYTPDSTPPSSPSSSIRLRSPRRLDSTSAEEIKALEDAIKRTETFFFPPKLTTFSEMVVSRSAGYATAEKFMEETSSVRVIDGIRIPTLAINAHDDPLLRGNDLPRDIVGRSAHMVMAVTKHGGHVGFYGTGTDGKTGGFARWCWRPTTEWISGIDELDVPVRPRPELLECRGFLYPKGYLGMAFMEVDPAFAKMAFMPLSLPRM